MKRLTLIVAVLLLAAAGCTRPAATPTVVVGTSPSTATVVTPIMPSATATARSVATPTATATPYVVREYTQKEADGSIVLVQQWSDGRFATKLIQAAPPTATPKPPAWQGAIVELSRVTFSVSQFYRSKQARSTIFSPRTAQGVFAVVKLNMTNNGSEPVSPILDFSFKLKDSLGRTFDYDGLASGRLGPDEGCSPSLGINPGLSGCIVVAFDIPEDARGLRIGIGGFFEDPSKWIALE